MEQIRDQKRATRRRDSVLGNVKTAIWLATLPCIAYALPAQAQNGVSQARTIVNQSVQITKNADLEFGDFVAGTTNSVFRLNPNSGNLTQRSGDAVAIGGTPSAASFTATGTPLFRVRITSNQNRIFLTRSGGTERMRVNRFRFDGRRNRTLDASGAVTYRVGGQLRVGPNQVPGTYTGNFNITVDYF